MEEASKTCPVCGVHKVLSDFYTRKNSADGYRKECKSCRIANEKARRLSNLDAFKEKDRLYHAKHKERKNAQARQWYAINGDAFKIRQRVNSWHTTLIAQCKSTSRKKGFAYDLSPEFLLSLFEKQGGLCHWLGVPLEPSPEWRNPLQPSVDRLDPAKGYTRDNVVLASQFANMGRSAMSAQRMTDFVSRLKDNLVSSSFKRTA